MKGWTYEELKKIRQKTADKSRKEGGKALPKLVKIKLVDKTDGGKCYTLHLIPPTNKELIEDYLLIGGQIMKI